MSLQYGMTTELKVDEEVRHADGLSVLLTSFSHKRPYVGGPTKATAYLTLKKGRNSGEIMLSIHGVQGKSMAEDGLPDSERYDTVVWNEYEFQLKGFTYDQSIEVITRKNG